MTDPYDVTNAAAADAKKPTTQRLRGLSFKKEYNQSMTASEPTIFQKMKARVTGTRVRQPSMIQEPGTHLVPAKDPKLDGRITVVLDLDETLIYARQGPLYGRPGLDPLFQLLRDKFEALVWTAGVKAYAQAVVRNIDKCDAIQHCIYRHRKWFTGRAGYNKDLTLLGREMETTLIVENTPDCLRGNEEHGILVADYEGGELEDQTLPGIMLLLEDMIERRTKENITVPQYITSSKYLTRQAIPSDVGDMMICYCLDINNRELFKAMKATRVNKDLKK